MPAGEDSLIPLAKGSTLYLGSAVPLETSVGLEALQMPLRDRYLTTDSSQKVSGIDTVLTVFSSGILMQYPGDNSSSTWFPMQTLHMCAAVKAVSNMGSIRFVSVDSPQAQASREPPIFAVIMRRSKGVKVLECHVFVCKSTEAALSFVQSCTHAFQHQTGWMSGIPGWEMFHFGAPSRIVAADSITGSSIMTDLPRTPLNGFMYSPDQQTQMYNISGMEPSRPQPAPAPPPVQAPAPAPPPAPAVAPAPTIQVIQPPAPAAAPVQFVAMNPPGALVPQFPQMTIPQGYFADWDQNFGMTYMVAPNSPLYPGDEVYNKEKNKKKNKKKHKKKNKKSKSKKKHEEEEEEEEDGEEEEEELYYVRRSKLEQGKQLTPDFAPVQKDQPEVRYSDQFPPEVRYVSEPVRPDGGHQTTSTEIHYIPLPKSSSYPVDFDLPPDHIVPSTTDIYLAREYPPVERPTTEVFLAKEEPRDGVGYFIDDHGRPGFDPYAYRVQSNGVDYDYRRDYDAARQPIYARDRVQGVYDTRLPRTNLDERGFHGMADGLGYFP